MAQYSYSNIIIVTNAIILEFFFYLICTFRRSATILSFFNTSQNIESNESQQLFNKVFFFTTMTSELSKYLNEQLGNLQEKCDFNKVTKLIQHGGSPVNLLAYFRTPFSKNTSGGMLLKARGIENVKGQKPCTFILQVKLKRKACSLDIMLLL